MQTLSAVMEWTYRAVATWYVAAIVGGLLIFAAERLSRRREPSDADVRRAADCYQKWYEDRSPEVITDHILGASFSPNSRHRAFLRRVLTEVERRKGRNLHSD